MFPSTLLKLMLAAALTLVAGVTIAQQPETTPEPETPYVVWAGGNADGQSGIRFYPARLQVHSGDIVTWEFHGPHNVHFGGSGRMTFTFTPTIEDGDVYQGGDANSGILVASEDPDHPTRFSLVIDLEPGVYRYVCDLHPGMTGVIEVVEDDAEIPTPEDVALERMGLTPEVTPESTHAGHS